MNVVRNRIALVKNGGDRGDQALSYLGVVVLVALIAVALIQLNLGKTIGDAVTKAVKSVTDAGGKAPAAGGADADKPVVGGNGPAANKPQP